MRSLRDVNNWRGTWVAGFSTISEHVGRNFLMYLMRIDKAFESHWSLWDELTTQVRQAKSTDTNQFGDVYRPLGRDTQENQFNACSYHQPHQSHKRRYDWPRDINYQRNGNHRRSALLLGDEEYSFVWDKCEILFNSENIGRGHRTVELGDFLHNHLCEANCRSIL
ncbi:MAG: hypothetical protein D4R45_05630 [Planctomycetaceae bacterium]|nr:MAG: hypothetical protein D4R45_05630 [Planctomycetaceae bacterium]